MEIDSTTSSSRIYSQLSHADRIDQKITKIHLKSDRDKRRELLQRNLQLKSSMSELQKLVKTGSAQNVENLSATLRSPNLGLSSGDMDLPISSHASLNGIQTGKLQINGISISVDRDVDSMNDVIQRINDANTGVTASYDATSGEFQLTAGDTFYTSNSSSSFFDSLGVPSGETSSGIKEARANFYTSDRFKSALSKFAQSFNRVFGALEAFEAEPLTSEGAGYEDNLKSAVEQALKNTALTSFGGEGKARLEFGYTFSFDGGDFLTFDAKEFDRKITAEVSTMEDFFNKIEKDGTGGLYAELTSALDSMNTGLSATISAYSSVGLLVNTSA